MNAKPLTVPAQEIATVAWQSAPRPASPAASDVSDLHALVEYANWCRIVATPEELILDFATHMPVMEEQVSVTDVRARVVTGWYTAKRILHALQLCIERHEAAFGVLETDVRKRVRSAERLGR